MGDMINLSARGEQHKDSCYFYSVNNHDWRQEPVIYEYLEEERVPDLESILADFMTYQASSKGYCYGMQQQGTQFQRNQSSTGYHWESCWQPNYDDKAEGVINLDDLLMQFKDTIESMQQAFRRTATLISKLVDDMANTEAREEEECIEIETGAHYKLLPPALSSPSMFAMPSPSTLTSSKTSNQLEERLFPSSPNRS
ncbi:hypothetical protein JHK87_050215 [Glycine soja]|nr:hypothetical protein JHK87_050215 [Glycine soja]